MSTIRKVRYTLGEVLILIGCGVFAACLFIAATQLYYIFGY